MRVSRLGFLAGLLLLVLTRPAHAQAAAWELLRVEAVTPTARSGADNYQWTRGAVTGEGFGATLTITSLVDGRLYRQAVDVMLKGPPRGPIMAGAKVPISLDAKLTFQPPPGARDTLWGPADTLGVWFEGNERFGLAPVRKTWVHAGAPQAEWHGDIEFPQPRGEQDMIGLAATCRWDSTVCSGRWEGEVRWYFVPSGLTVSASPSFSGPGTSTLVRLKSSTSLGGAVVDFGPGITMVGSPTATLGSKPGTHDLDCLIKIAPDAALGPRTISLKLPDGKQARTDFTVRPLVIILDIDGMRPDILLRCILSKQAKNLAALLGEQTAGPQAAGQPLRRHEFEHGVYLLDTATVFPSYTFAAQASIFTGVEPGVHGVTGNMVFDRLGSMKGNEPDVYGFDRALTDAIGVYYFSALADKALRSPTIYEAMAGRPGVGRSGVFSNQYANGVAAADRWVPLPIDMAAYMPALTTGLYDTRMSAEARGWLWQHVGKPPTEWPSLVTFYFAGLDHTGHVVNETEEVKQTRYLVDYVDREVGFIINQAAVNYPGAVFILTADHGQTDIQEGRPITRQVLNRALAKDNWLPHAWTPATTLAISDIVITQNGGLAHVHVRAREPGTPATLLTPGTKPRNLSWREPPAFDDVLRVAERLRDLNESGAPELGAGPYFDLILVRDATEGWEAPYQVYTGYRECEEVVAYLTRTGNAFGQRLGWQGDARDIAFLAERLQAVSCERSGDVVVVPRYPRFYAEDGAVFGEHGSLKATDMTIPFMVAQWQAHDVGQMVKVLERTVEDPRRPRVTDIAPTVAGFLGQVFRGRKHPLAEAAPSEPGAAPGGAVIGDRSGDAQVRLPGGDWRPAAAGLPLPAGTALRTGADGRASVRLPAPESDTGEQLVLAQVLTEILIDIALGGRGEVTGTLDLSAGAIELGACRPKGAPSQLAVRAPLATVRGRGGRCLVRHTAQAAAETAILALDSGIEVTPRDVSIQAFTLAAGQEARLRSVPGAAPKLTISGGEVTPPPPARPGRVLAYRQISSFGDRLAIGNGIQPILSRNGRSIALSFAPDPADTERKERVATVQPDGSGFRWLDAYAPLRYVSLTVDINATGTAIASTDFRQVRVVGVGGGAARQVLLVDGGIDSIRLSPDGATVYFAQGAASRLTGTQTTLGKGIYAISGAGSPRLVAGEQAIAAALGITVADLGPIRSGSNGKGLDVSDDGRWLVFIASEKGLRTRRHALVVATDGTGLRRVFTVEGGGAVCSVGISGDGNQVALSAQRPGKEGYEGWIMDSSGGGQELMTSRAAPMGSVCMGDRGSAVFGQEGVVWSAEGVEALPLATPASIRGARLGGATLQDLTVDRRGRLGIFVVYDAKGLPQLARVEVDPADLGDGPDFGQVVCPAALVANARALARVSARVTSAHPLLGAAVVPVAYREAQLDTDIGRSVAMADGGQSGDEKAGDGTYASDLLHAEAKSLPGPRLIRFYAEVAAGDGRHSATAVEAGRPEVTPAP